MDELHKVIKKAVSITQVCGNGLFGAMFIDVRRREDDVPVAETRELITKMTPW